MVRILIAQLLGTTMPEPEPSDGHAGARDVRAPREDEPVLVGLG